MDPLRRALRTPQQKLSNLAARAQILTVDDSRPIQLVQLLGLEGELRGPVERFQQYGLTSVPNPGAFPGMLLCPQGDRLQGILIVCDDGRSRPRSLSAGDVCLYDSRGNRVHLQDDVLEITAVAGLRIVVTGDATIEVSGAASIEAGGDVTVETGGAVEVTAAGDATIEAVNVEVTATAAATVAAPAVNLGGPGGPPVARVGDSVNLMTGLIVSGSPVVTAT
jgi:phage baseplate assembly protein V